MFCRGASCNESCCVFGPKYSGGHGESGVPCRKLRLASLLSARATLTRHSPAEISVEDSDAKDSRVLQSRMRLEGGTTVSESTTRAAPRAGGQRPPGEFGWSLRSTEVARPRRVAAATRNTSFRSGRGCWVRPGVRGSAVAIKGIAGPLGHFRWAGGAPHTAESRLPQRHTVSCQLESVSLKGIFVPALRLLAQLYGDFVGPV